MNDAATGLDAMAAEWLRVVWRASWEGSLALLLAWLFCSLLPGVTGNLRCWVWRLAYMKLLVALLLWQPIDLPLLKARPEIVAGAPASSPTTRPGPWDFRPPALLESPTRSPMWSPAVGVPASRAAGQPIRFGTAACWLFVWLLGVGVRGGHLAVQWRSLGRWRRACQAGDDPRLTALAAGLCRQFRIGRPPAILVHPTYGPFLLGGPASAIVLPSQLVCSASDAELQLVLTHELAHLKRRDPLWTSVVVLAQTLFFFHPLVWLGRRQYRLAQEAACDEMTVRATGASVREYAELLLKVALGHRTNGWSSGALGVLGSGMALDRRITLLQQLGTRSKRQAMLAGTAAALVALGWLAPWRVVAQTLPPEAGKPAPPPAEGERRPGTSGAGTGEAGAAWEEMLLLQATRYLRLSSTQLQQLLPMARTANRQLSGLQLREDKVRETFRQIALRQRDALVAGRPGSLQEQADAISMRENARRSRSETESSIVTGSLTGLARLLTPKQVERAFLLEQGLTPEGEAREPALLDPASGFVTGPFGDAPVRAFNGPGGAPGTRAFNVPGGAAGNPRATGNPANLAQQLLQAQTQLSMLQQHLSEPDPPFPPGAVGRGVFVRDQGDGKPPVVFRFGTGTDLPAGAPPPGGAPPEVMDPAAFRQHLTEEAQALSRQVNDLRRQLFKPDGGVPPEQYEALLRPLARRLFLSTRFQEALENRLHGEN
jgi:beta-lactamase regulating signal transducer with metallopeptidase domain